MCNHLSRFLYSSVGQSVRLLTKSAGTARSPVRSRMEKSFGFFAGCLSVFKDFVGTCGEI